MTFDNGKERIIRPKRCGVTKKVRLENASSIAHIGLQNQRELSVSTMDDNIGEKKSKLIQKLF